MSEFCYVLEDRNGTRLYLSGEGLQEHSEELAEQIKLNDFRHVEDRSISSCTLHVFERTTPATDIVDSDAEQVEA